MAFGSGHGSKAAFKLQDSTTYPGTAIACGAGNQIPFSSESVKRSKNVEPLPTLDGKGGYSDHVVISKRDAGEITCQGFYRSLEQLLAASLGFSHASNSPINPTGSVYRHLFELSENLHIEDWRLGEKSTVSGSKIRAGTLCVDKQINIDEHLGSMINQLRIIGDATRGQIQFVFGVAANAMDTASAINTSSASWTYTLLSKIAFDDLVFRLRPADEYSIGAINDVLEVVEDTAGTPDNNLIDVPDGTYSGGSLAAKIQQLLNAGTSNSILYKVTYSNLTHKFTIKNTNTAHLIQVDYSDSQLAATIGFQDDPTAALSITGHTPGYYINAALDSNDAVGISGFEITLDNFLDIDSQTNDSNLKIKEPVRSRPRSVSLTISQPRYTTTTLLDRVDEDSWMVADFRFTGAVIDGAYSEEFNIFFPQLKLLTGATNVVDAGAIRPSFPMVASVPQKDMMGFNEYSTSTSNELDAFLIQEVLDFSGSAATIYDMVVFNGRLYAATGDTNGLLCEFAWGDTAFNAHASFPYDVSATFESITAMAAFDGKLYVACLDSATDDTHIFSWDGDRDSISWTDEETFTDLTVNAMFTSEKLGLMLVGLSNGDIYSSADGSTYTVRDNTNLADCTGFVEWTDADGTWYLTASGNEATPYSRLLKSTNGTSWSVLSTGQSFTKYSDIDNRENGFCVTQQDGSDRFSISIWETSTRSNSFSITSYGTAYSIKYYKGWVYAGGEDTSNNSVLIRFDIQAAKDLAYKVTSGNEFKTIVEYNGWLFFGGKNAKIYCRRPFQEMQIELQNTESANPMA